MGKFYEALKRSGTIKERGDSKSARDVVVKVPKEAAPQREGTLPRIRSEGSHAPGEGIDARLVSLLDPTSPAAECFKMLRTKLLVASRERPLRSILVTSAEPLDGKSLVAANLAVTIAQGINDYVLLVDCDLRAPSLHKMFNLPGDGGIQGYLSGGTPLAGFLVKTPLKKLTLLPGGESSPNPSELLCSHRMRVLVDELKGRYDDRYIIFDSPPGQFAAETAFLARMMDAVILVVRYGKTPMPRVLETVENIGTERILGVVFNASLERQRDYRYYYRYYRKRKA